MGKSALRQRPPHTASRALTQSWSPSSSSSGCPAKLPGNPPNLGSHTAERSHTTSSSSSPASSSADAARTTKMMQSGKRCDLFGGITTTEAASFDTHSCTLKQKGKKPLLIFYFAHTLCHKETSLASAGSSLRLQRPNDRFQGRGFLSCLHNIMSA